MTPHGTGTWSSLQTTLDILLTNIIIRHAVTLLISLTLLNVWQKTGLVLYSLSRSQLTVCCSSD